MLWDDSTAILIRLAYVCSFAMLSVSAPAPSLVEELPLGLLGADGILLQVFGCSYADTAFPKPSSLVHKAALAPGFPYDAAEIGLLQALAFQNYPK